MPELPELEVVREVLTRRLAGRQVVAVTVAPKGGPIVVRDLTGRGFVECLTGAEIQSVARRGKFLLFTLSPPSLVLAVNPKLTGRFQLCPPGAKKAGPVHVTLHFRQPEEQLRYVDQKTMGQMYLTGDLAGVPTFTEMEPSQLPACRASSPRAGPAPRVPGQLPASRASSPRAVPAPRVPCQLPACLEHAGS
jgi:formamidopyrimidine-DNA glycosylase